MMCSLARIRQGAVTAIVAAGMMAMAVPALAHEGHSGAKIVFVATNAALKQMLPAGAKVALRKQQFTAADVAWAKSSLKAGVDAGIYTYYLARGANDAFAGSAMVTEIPYRHGKVEIAVGLDAAGNVSRAAVLSASEKAIPHFADSVGKGFLDAFKGAPISRLAEKAAALSEEDGGRIILERLFEMAAVLATFQHGMAS